MALARKHRIRYGFDEENQGVSGSKAASWGADSFSLSGRIADDSAAG